MNRKCQKRYQDSVAESCQEKSKVEGVREEEKEEEEGQEKKMENEMMKEIPAGVRQRKTTQLQVVSLGKLYQYPAALILKSKTILEKEML